MFRDTAGDKRNHCALPPLLSLLLQFMSWSCAKRGTTPGNPLTQLSLLPALDTLVGCLDVANASCLCIAAHLQALPVPSTSRALSPGGVLRCSQRPCPGASWRGQTRSCAGSAGWGCPQGPNDGGICPGSRHYLDEEIQWKGVSRQSADNNTGLMLQHPFLLLVNTRGLVTRQPP